MEEERKQTAKEIEKVLKDEQDRAKVSSKIKCDIDNDCFRRKRLFGFSNYLSHSLEVNKIVMLTIIDKQIQ